MRTRLAFGGLAIWSGLLTLLLYGAALELPFFFDDLDLLPFSVNTSLSTIWQTAGSFPYFRPLTATVWRVVYLLFGELNSVALHAVNLILHSLNGWLVGYIGSHLFAPKRVPGLQQRWNWDIVWLSSTFFLIYPFSFQAVPWVGSLSHLLVTSLLLSNLCCFAIFHRRQQIGWAFLSLLFTFLAPFAHENGVMAFPIIVLYTLIQKQNSEKSTFQLKYLLLWFLPLLLWFPIWFFAPKTKDALTLNGAEAIMQNMAYFGQGIGYPFTWMGGWLRDHWGWNDLLTAILLTTVAILFLFYGQSVSKQEKAHTNFLSIGTWLKSVQAFPWYWCIMTILPAILLLSFNYTISAPRLLLTPSVGISWLWAYTFSKFLQVLRETAVTPNNPPQRRHILTALASCLFLFVIIVQNIHFVTRFMFYHTLLGNVTNLAVDKIVETNEIGRSAILINFPNETRGHTTTYPLGHEGVVFLVDYLSEQNLINIQAGQQTDFALLQYTDLRSNEHSYAYGLLGEGTSWPQLAVEKPNATVYLTTYADDSIKLEQVGQWQPDVSSENPVITFTDAETRQTIMLVNGCVQAEATNLEVWLLWQTEVPSPASTTIFVHVLNDQGELVAQKDGFVFGGTYPMKAWQQSTLLQDVRTIPFAGDSFAVYVGLYNWVTGERLTAVSINNRLLPEMGYQLPVCGR